MKKTKKRNLNLFLFEGEGGGSPAGEGVATPQAEGNVKVVYGKADDQTETLSGVATGKDQTQSKVSLKDLIKNDPTIAEEHQALLKEQMDKRFKGQSKLQKQLESTQSIIDMLAMAHGTSDINELREALERDNRMFEDAADRAGMTVEQYKKYQKAQWENQQLKQAQMTREQEMESERIYAELMDQAEQLKEVYPDFDLETEIENDQFKNLLTLPGMTMEQAYKVIHLDDIIGSAARTVATQVKKNTIDSVKARGVRPAENGINEQPGVVRKDDVSKLTKQDRARIAELAARGVEIKL